MYGPGVVDVPAQSDAKVSTEAAPLPGPTPASSSPVVRRQMQRLPRRDTGVELELRRELHRRGLRYRVDAAPLSELRRKADVVFRSARVAVFVDGCFWHACPDHGTLPKSNSDWWATKLARTRWRDADTVSRLSEAGWHVVRMWEHEDPASTADHIESLVRSRLNNRQV